MDAFPLRLPLGSFSTAFILRDAPAGVAPAPAPTTTTPNPPAPAAETSAPASAPATEPKPKHKPKHKPKPRPNMGNGQKKAGANILSGAIAGVEFAVSSHRGGVEAVSRAISMIAASTQRGREGG